MAEYRSSVMSTDGSDTVEEDHYEINTENDEKNVRINSRDYTRTTGDQTAVQIKPNMSVTGAGGITGIEVSPRFDENCAGAKLVGVMSNPILKGKDALGTGDLSSTMECYKGKLESDSGNTRTVAEAFVFHANQSLHGTVTDGPWVLKVDTPGGNVAWAGFALLPDDGEVASDSGTITLNSNGWIRVKIGDTTLYIPVGSKD